MPAAAFAGGLPVNQGTWLAEPQTASIPAGQLTAVAANVNGLRAALQNAQQLPALTLTTSLPAVLDGTASDLDVARSLLAICAVLLFLLAAAALLAAARLLAGQREGESAMLTARGATRWQLVAADRGRGRPAVRARLGRRRRARRAAGPAGGFRGPGALGVLGLGPAILGGRPAAPGWPPRRSPPGRR